MMKNIFEDSFIKLENFEKLLEFFEIRFCGETKNSLQLQKFKICRLF